MNRDSNLLGSLALAAAFAGAGHLANIAPCYTEIQQGVGKGPISVPRDPEMEKQAYHSLEVARYYFYKRKPDKNDKEGWARLNKSVEGRLTEILDTNPTFARMDDVYFMLGEVYKRMGDLDKATEYWEKAAKETSDEKIKSEVEKRLAESKKK
jgi:tetratricopeptide (TPR) repeat protein